MYHKITYKNNFRACFISITPLSWLCKTSSVLFDLWIIFLQRRAQLFLIDSWAELFWFHALSRHERPEDDMWFLVCVRVHGSHCAYGWGFVLQVSRFVCQCQCVTSSQCVTSVRDIDRYSCMRRRLGSHDDSIEQMTFHTRAQSLDTVLPKRASNSQNFLSGKFNRKKSKTKIVLLEVIAQNRKRSHV